MDLWFSMGEPIANLIIDLPDHPENLMPVRDKLMFYENAVERLLGATENSLKLVEASGMWEALQEMERRMKHDRGGRE